MSLAKYLKTPRVFIFVEDMILRVKNIACCYGYALVESGIVPRIRIAVKAGLP
jgi:hypothetical protein